eukprot:CAMPEP_0168618466 /NCGR_PEP_ID=MMETSP0449_2-20121227/6087_1 /TAXON_ID=1082188 /ORGANISM="Strombidium rassoulzadegani, Strain ras09" /LENGTH=76 /DNA_ID=CAMNT_0008659343 /DNA_START=307 /DNA_END=537 /DNA_ORIENTATION=+
MAQNEKMKADYDRRVANGQEKNHILEGYGHGLRGKHGNALYLLHESKEEIFGIGKQLGMKVPEDAAQNVPQQDLKK